MTNEEMVLEIKNGKQEYLEDLWLAVEKLIRMQAKKFYKAYIIRCQQMGIELEDLIQVGYFAVLGAVEDYKGNYKFTTYLYYHLKTQFRKAIKIRFTGWEKNTVHQACSIDDLAYPNSDTLVGDTLYDRRSEEAIDAVVDDEYNRQLHAAFSEAFIALTQAQYEAIQRCYYDGLTYREYARERGVVNVGNSLISPAFKKLRRNEELAIFARELS